MSGDSDARFALRVRGNSMIDACICDGSIVICSEQSEVENGQIAVCIVDGEEATLKRFYRHENGIITLRAENSEYQDVVFTPREARQLIIKGRALYVLSRVH